MFQTIVAFLFLSVALFLLFRTWQLRRGHREFHSIKELLVEERTLRQGLQYRVNAIEIVEEVSTSFTNIPIDRIDSEIERVLGELGHSAGADRAYLFCIQRMENHEQYS